MYSITCLQVLKWSIYCSM